MSKASEAVHNLVTRPRSPMEIQEERQATSSRPSQVVVNGQILELSPNPFDEPRLIETLPQQVDD